MNFFSLHEIEGMTPNCRIEASDVTAINGALVGDNLSYGMKTVGNLYTVDKCFLDNLVEQGKFVSLVFCQGMGIVWAVLESRYALTGPIEERQIKELTAEEANLLLNQPMF